MIVTLGHSNSNSWKSVLVGKVLSEKGGQQRKYSGGSESGPEVKWERYETHRYWEESLGYQWKEWKGHQSLEQIDLWKVTFWVQFHGLTLEEMAIKNARKLGACMGVVTEVECSDGEMR